MIFFVFQVAVKYKSYRRLYNFKNNYLDAFTNTNKNAKKETNKNNGQKLKVQKKQTHHDEHFKFRISNHG